MIVPDWIFVEVEVGEEGGGEEESCAESRVLKEEDRA